LRIVAGSAIYDLQSPPKIILTNHSSTPVWRITVSGSGFNETVSWLQSDRTTVVVHPAGDSSLNIGCDTPGGHRSFSDLAYIECVGGYKVDVEVKPDYALKVSERLSSL
jgi:hypothetical protein